MTEFPVDSRLTLGHRRPPRYEGKGSHGDNFQFSTDDEDGSLGVDQVESVYTTAEVVIVKSPRELFAEESTTTTTTTKATDEDSSTKVSSIMHTGKTHFFRKYG